MNPCFTTLSNQILNLAIGTNFHTFHLHQPQQPLVFCTTPWLINCMQRKCISAVFWQNPIKHPPDFHQIYLSVSIGPSHVKGCTEFSKDPLGNNVSPHFTIESHSSVASPFFHYNPLSLFQTLHKISIGPDEPPHISGSNKIPCLEIFFQDFFLIYKEFLLSIVTPYFHI